MTELEKLRNGDYYSMEDAEIIAIHQRAANICQQFNALPVTESEERNKLSATTLGSVRMWVYMPWRIRWMLRGVR